MAISWACSPGRIWSVFSGHCETSGDSWDTPAGLLAGAPAMYAENRTGETMLQTELRLIASSLELVRWERLWAQGRGYGWWSGGYPMGWKWGAWGIGMMFMVLLFWG